MKTGKFDIYVIGVGGQGIGLLSETLLRAADHAGLPVRGVDTHGAHSPLIMAGQADMVAALERHEAWRGMNSYLKDGGALAYYDAVWQPLNVRLKKEAVVTSEAIGAACGARGIREVRVFRDDLPDPLMQNMALLAEICRLDLVPGVGIVHCEAALNDLLEGAKLEKNLALLRRIVQG
jgi:indolepyruvate ferredoxin oxidoreductase, beta subunit